MRADGRWRRLLVVPLLVGAVAGAGCGDGGDADRGSDGSEGGSGGVDVEAAHPEGFEASPAYLAAAIDASGGVPHRFEATVTIGMARGETVEGIPAMTGEFDGERSSTETDPALMAEAMGGLPPQLVGVDLGMQLVTDGDVTYIHAPGYADLGLPVDATTPPMIALAQELGDKWGRVDLAALGDESARMVSQLNQGQNLDPAFFLELVQATDRVEELGGDIVDGRAQIGLSADVPMVAILEAQGIDAAALTASAAPDTAEALASFSLGVEVWLDGEGLVRRLGMDLGKGLEQLLEEHELEGEERFAGFEFRTDITFSDHGDESIEVDLPAEGDTIDVTETVRELGTGA